MALPTVYTEETYIAYLHALLNQGGFADDLGWTVGSSYNEIVNEALLKYGADDIATITGSANINKVRVAGRVALWEAVLDSVTHMRDSRTASGTQSSLSQIYDHAEKQLERTKANAAIVGLDGVAAYPPITITPVRYTDDPYARYVSTEDDA